MDQGQLFAMSGDLFELIFIKQVIHKNLNKINNLYLKNYDEKNIKYI